MNDELESDEPYSSSARDASTHQPKQPLRPRAPAASGCAALDAITGIGGLIPGQIVEIYGRSGAWKSTIALQMLAAAQKDSRLAILLDADRSFDHLYAASLGVDMRRLISIENTVAEAAMDMLYKLVATGAFCFVLIDSIASLIPRSELDREIGASPPGLQARLMSQALRKLVAVSAKNATTILAVNHLYDERWMGKRVHATPGGPALRNFAGLRLMISHIETLFIGGRASGSRIIMHITKNRYGVPGRAVELNMYFGRGFDNLEEIGDIRSLPIPFEGSSIDNISCADEDTDELD